jgi:hypothetical protein
MANPMQNVESKVGGKAAAAEAHLKGLRGVFIRLAQQHRAADALLSRALHTEELRVRQELWAELRKQLISHEQGELLEVYPLLEADETLRDIARRHAEHANDLEDAIGELDTLDARSSSWRPALERLVAIVKEHVALEEQELFPRAQQAIGDEVAKQLEQPYLRAQELAAQSFG